MKNKYYIILDSGHNAMIMQEFENKMEALYSFNMYKQLTSSMDKKDYLFKSVVIIEGKIIKSKGFL